MHIENNSCINGESFKDELHHQNLKAEIRISDRTVSHQSSKLLKMQIPGPHFRTAKSALVGEGKLEVVMGVKWRWGEVERCS